MLTVSRRRFLGGSAAAAAPMFVPGLLRGGEAARPLNVAVIGCSGKGLSDATEIAPGNRIAFLCDIDRAIAYGPTGAGAKFPDARFFSDYREMFAECADKIDVVTISTPDHMHFAIALEAIRRGKPVMVQKPLSNNLREVRVLAEYARKKGVLTVMGNQGATFTGTRLAREWIEAGVIGEVKEVYYWTNRPIWPQGKGLVFPEAPVPKDINWEVWQGNCSVDRPYSPKIHPFAWRAFWDYGCGALGDIACHSFYQAFWALDLRGDFEVELVDSGPFDDATAPEFSTMEYRFPARGARGPVRFVWQDGIKDPNTDKRFRRPPGLPADLNLPKDFAQAIVGTEGTLYLSDPYGRSAPAVYPEKLRERARAVKPVYARVLGGPTQELCRAVRGQGPVPVSNFAESAGPLTELALVGNLALRLGRKIEWDSAKLEARGCPEAAKFIERRYRKGWEPDLS